MQTSGWHLKGYGSKNWFADNIYNKFVAQNEKFITKNFNIFSIVISFIKKIGH